MDLIDLLLAAGAITDEQAAFLRETGVDADSLTDVDGDTLDSVAEILNAAADALLDVDATDEALQALEGVADALAAVSAEGERREAEAAERAERREALAARIRGAADDDDADDDETEGPVSEADDDDEGGEHTDDDPAADGDDDGATAEAEPEPVAASTTPRVSRVAARRPERHVARPAAELAAERFAGDVGTWGLTASANVPGVTRGERITSEAQFARVATEAVEALYGRPGTRNMGATEKVSLFRLDGGADDPSAWGDRYLGRDPIENARRIDAVTSLAAMRAEAQRRAAAGAIVASGGICAPSENRYDQPVVGTESRPIRDALVRFGVDRGGVVTLPPPALDDVGTGISVWTNANDESPSDPATKPYDTVSCPSETETLVGAITKRLRFGEFRRRFFAEQIAAWTSLQAVAHARKAEQQIVAKIDAGSIAVTAGEATQGLAAAPQFLAALDKLATAERSFHRTGLNFPFRVIIPEWFYALMRIDISRMAPGGGVVNDETLALADATIARWFAARNLNPTYTPDTQVYTAQATGAVKGIPSTVEVRMFPEGAWLFLDGGSLDLGLIRDSTLNNTNDVEMFAETFESAHKHHGMNSYKLTVDVCPSGNYAALIDWDACASGS